jgi:hypothetical protein
VSQKKRVDENMHNQILTLWVNAMCYYFLLLLLTKSILVLYNEVEQGDEIKLVNN